jgi:hypothetical protein
MQVTCNSKSRICNALQLMRERELLSSHSSEMHIL